MTNLTRVDLGEYLYCQYEYTILAAKIMVHGFDIYICIFEGQFSILLSNQCQMTVLVCCS